MERKTIERWTSSAIRYAYPLKSGRWCAVKNTHQGCCDFVMVYEDENGNLKDTEYDTAEQALDATESGRNFWYH